MERLRNALKDTGHFNLAEEPHWKEGHCEAWEPGALNDCDSYCGLCVAGYMFNIGMLKKVFAPSFQLHDIKQTGEYEATTRWTMIMKPTLNKTLRLQRFWDPQLVFTGVSIMGVNPENGMASVPQTDQQCMSSVTNNSAKIFDPWRRAHILSITRSMSKRSFCSRFGFTEDERNDVVISTIKGLYWNCPVIALTGCCTGKFNKHIDLWDALEPENQEFLSREGVSHVFSQLTASASTPDLETPHYTILKKKKKYEVRRWGCTRLL